MVGKARTYGETWLAALLDDQCSEKLGADAILYNSGAISLAILAAKDALGEAAAWVDQRPNAFVVDADPLAGGSRRMLHFDTGEKAETKRWLKALAGAAAAQGPAKRAVTLRLYDVGGDAAVSYVNKLLLPLGTGAFHSAVEIGGVEWSYGYSEEEGDGVFCCEPAGCEMHRYREAIPLGCTPLDADE
eukprot:2452668-Amphidinium_carterae.1